jgi:hypothetical protein
MTTTGDRFVASDQGDDTNVPSSDAGSAEACGRSGIRDDSPEALVWRENRAIRCLKLFAIVVLLVATLLASGMIFQFTRGSEKATFESDFALIAEAITQSISRDTNSYISSAQAIATTVTLLIEAYNTSKLDFSVPLSRFQSLTAQVVISSFYATWSPLIRSDEERHQFEKMVAKKEEEGFFEEFFNPPCFVCGEESMAPSTPDAIVVYPGLGQYKCGDVDAAGRTGVIKEASCSYMTSPVLEQCACKASSLFQAREDERNPSAGIFRLGNDENRTIEEEPWDGGPYLPMFLDSHLVLDHQPVLYNQLSYPKLSRAVSQMLFTGTPQMTEMIGHEESTFYSKYADALHDPDSGPASILYFPVQDPHGTGIVGALSVQLSWGNVLKNQVPGNGRLANIVIESTCGQVHTYKVKAGGIQLEWIGEGDFHDQAYDHMVRQTSYQDFSSFRMASVDQNATATQANSCDYRFSGK